MAYQYNIYTLFNEDNGDISETTGTEVTTGLWSGDTGSLSSVFTSSVQFGVSGEYYYDLYNANPAVTQSAEVQFSVAYGHVSGGGSPPLDPNVLGGTSTLPTQVTYTQYRNILLNRGESRFSFTDASYTDDIYVINVSRSRLKQALDPGNWQLGLSGSNGIRTFIDDSGLGTAVVGNLIASNVYKIRSGSLSSGIAGGDSNVYGLVFPDYGVILLQPSLISSSVGLQAPVNNARTSTSLPFAPFTGSVTTYQYQHEGLVRSISGAMTANSAFIARSAESITSVNYFVNLGSTKYNYSNNPTYYTGSAPQLVLPAFRNKPISYVTTIGLYNDANELLAVAKLSRPVQKSGDKAVLVRVRLDY
jgi:hypothetical protein